MMEKCIDIDLCLTLSHGKPALAADLLTLLLEELPLNRTDINSALDELRFADAHDLIHKLHGACCYCGVPSLKMICKKMERQLHIELKMPDLDDRDFFNETVDELLLWKNQHNIQILFKELNK